MKKRLTPRKLRATSGTAVMMFIQFACKTIRNVVPLAEVKHILQQTDAVGRRLDFLMQELNREANTLGSKSIDIRTSNAAMELKVLIEQMREQVQNIE